MVLANSGGDGHDDLGFHYLDVHHALEPTPQHQLVKVPLATLQSYVGQYDTDFGVAIAVTEQQGQLQAKFGGQFALDIFPETPQRFFYRAIDAVIEFEPSAQGMMLYLLQDGERYPARRR